MKNTLLTLVLATFSTSALADSAIPDWFLQDLEKHVGTWLTDNSEYQSENEPAEAYGMEWQYGIGKTSITGRLFGIVDGAHTEDFWHFRQFWDNQKQTAVLVQYGASGVIGEGEVVLLDDGISEVIQEFSVPSGQTWKTKHLATNDGETQQTTSYDFDNDGKWIKQRSYVWFKQLVSD